MPEADVDLAGNEFTDLVDLEVCRTHAHEQTKTWI